MPDMKTLAIGETTYTVVDANAVHFTEQTLTDEQKAQTRENIGAATVDEVLAALPDEIISLASSSPSIQMEADKEYVCTESVTSLTVTGFAAGTGGKPVEYSVMFRAGASITVTLPDTVVWANGEPTFSANKGYYLAFIPMYGQYLGVCAEVE